MGKKPGLFQGKLLLLVLVPSLAPRRQYSLQKAKLGPLASRVSRAFIEHRDSVTSSMRKSSKGSCTSMVSWIQWPPQEAQPRQRAGDIETLGQAIG